MSPSMCLRVRRESRIGRCHARARPSADGDRKRLLVGVRRILNPAGGDFVSCGLLITGKVVNGVGGGRKAHCRYRAYTPLVPGSRGDTLLNMMLFIERFTLNRAWSDLSEEEFFWEPAANCWSVRHGRSAARPTPSAAVTGSPTSMAP